MKTILLCLAAMLLVLTTSGFAEDLSKGSSGEGVIALQNQLASLGYDVGQIDGSFGGRTESALREFQSIHGLPVTGAYDAATRKEIEEDLALNTAQTPLYTATPVPTATPQPTAQTVSRPKDDGIHAYGYYIDDCEWEEARLRALRLGGYLVNINSTAEYNEIQSEILELGYSDVEFWIGALRDSRSDSFLWTDSAGETTSEAIDFSALMNGTNPWALGCPSTQTGTYVRMRYSEEEKRWIWEDIPEGIALEKKTGYIIEFDDALPISRTIQTAEEDGSAFAAGMDYHLDLMGLEEHYVVAKVTASAACRIQIDIWNDSYDYLYCSFNAEINGGVNDRLVRFAIPESSLQALPEQYKVEATLYSRGGPLGYSDRTDWAACDRQTYVMTADGSTDSDLASGQFAYRTSLVMASDPVSVNPNVMVELYNGQSGALVQIASQGETVYLNPGIYRIHLPGNQCGDMLLNMLDSPMMVFMQDQTMTTVSGQLVSAKTGRPIAEARLTLELQGRSYSAVTDENGAFSMQNLPPVKGRLTVAPDASGQFGEYQLDVQVGTDQSKALRLELE